MAAEFQDRLPGELMPAKKPKEAPAIVDDVASAAGSRAAARLPAFRPQTTAVVKVTAVHGDAADWRGTCAICFDLLPVEPERQIFYPCCCKRLCKECAHKCRQHDKRCPLCRAPAPSEAEWLRRLQKHVNKGHAEAQFMLGQTFKDGGMGLKQSLKRAFQLYQLAAAQGNPLAQTALGVCYEHGKGVKIDFSAAALWYRRAAEQGNAIAQYDLGAAFYNGRGVAQSYDEAVRWFHLAAAHGQPEALCNLGLCYAKGQGVPQDFDEAMRFLKGAAAKGHADAAVRVEQHTVLLAARPGRPT